jgi:ring-1,2-phenylacetyl-CoA epoxidase subunit PaaC
LDKNAKFVSLSRLGDTTLVLSHRLAELCGKGPALEEDMALANVALDLLGQARMWLSYAGEIEGNARTEDDLAYLRGEREFHNFLLVEMPNRDYADVLMRQFYFDAWHSLALAKLSTSTDPRIAEIAVKAAKEVAYHLRRSSDLAVRLGDGTAESHAKMQDAANELWQYTGEMFSSDEVDAGMAASGEGFDPKLLQNDWRATVEPVFAQATLQMPPLDAWMQKGGKKGVHTEHLGYLLAEMQVLPRAYGGAQW